MCIGLLTKRCVVLRNYRKFFVTCIKQNFLSNDSASKSKLEEHQKKLMSRGLPQKKKISGVKNIVLIVSGKGGVGKSTTAVNTAIALSEIHNFKVGLLDADVFGPSVPLMMGLNESPLLNTENRMIPPENYGVKW